MKYAIYAAHPTIIRTLLYLCLFQSSLTFSSLHLSLSLTHRHASTQKHIMHRHTNVSLKEPMTCISFGSIIYIYNNNNNLKGVKGDNEIKCCNIDLSQLNWNVCNTYHFWQLWVRVWKYIPVRKQNNSRFLLKYKLLFIHSETPFYACNISWIHPSISK